MQDLSYYLLILLVLLLLFLFIKYVKAKRKYNNINNTVRRREEEKKATAKRRYVTPKMKTYILKRDNYTCQICGISKGLFDSFIPHLGDYLLLEVDHIVPVASGGYGDDENNLQTLCWRCNRKKGNTKTNEEVKKLIDYGIDLDL